MFEIKAVGLIFWFAKRFSRVIRAAPERSPLRVVDPQLIMWVVTHETKSGSFPVAAVKVCETFPHAVCKLLRSHERSYEPGLNRLFLFSSTRGCHPGFSHDMPLSLSYVHKGAGETDCEILFHRWFLVRGRCCQPTGCSLCGLCCCFVTSQVLHIALCCSSAVISVLVSVSSQE